MTDNGQSMDSSAQADSQPAAVTTQPVLPGDSTMTKLEKTETNGLGRSRPDDDDDEGMESKSKRPRLDDGRDDPRRGMAPVKAEYLIEVTGKRVALPAHIDDDEAESGGHNPHDTKPGSKRNKGQRGQNKNRDYGFSKDAIPLCSSRMFQPEFSPAECKFGERCKFEHDLRKYLKDGKREDLTTFNGLCPVWEKRGKCNAGWKCRFVGSHSEERVTENGQKELVLKEDPVRIAAEKAQRGENEEPEDEAVGSGVVNVVTAQQKLGLSKKVTKTPKSEAYINWLTANGDTSQEHRQSDKKSDGATEAKQDSRAEYVEAPFRPSEKRRLYYGPETPMLAPLTTQGNLPFRRLCVELGAEVTWSEMAMGMPLIQGEKGEWALVKAHESETTPPRFESKGDIVAGYDHSKDLKFGVQIAANKPWLACKATEVLTMMCPRLRAIDLNCGCPIDLLYRQGAGSALLDSHGKLEKCLRSMIAVSGEVPITVKIRMGTHDNNPTSKKLVSRLVNGIPMQGSHTDEGPCGVAAITLHGRSRQQRYSRKADWGYISECAALITRLKQEQAEQTDTAAAIDPRDLPNGGKVYFVGNGDCYSHTDYYDHLNKAKVDTVMIGRGGLIKPWLFEEISAGQYLDKSASERLGYIERFAKYGLEAWGSDEQGVGTTRRFLLEWLSFTCRYVPIGLLEHLPPHMNDRPPAYRGRSDLETLLASSDYRDWIKISEMFLGPAHPNFKFVPKHKSNSYEMEAEG